MSISIEISPVMPTRPCSFSLCLQGGAVFADFDKDNAGVLSLRRISFDGFGCCEAPKAITRISSDNSKALIDAISRGDIQSSTVEEILRKYFQENKDLIWSDALTEHDLL